VASTIKHSGPMRGSSERVCYGASGARDDGASEVLKADLRNARWVLLPWGTQLSRRLSGASPRALAAVRISGETMGTAL